MRVLRRPPNLSHDDLIEQRLTEFFERHHIDGRLILRNFPLYARRITIKRFLAHYELFRQVVDKPGDIVELGVYRGTTLVPVGQLHGGPQYRRPHPAGHRIRQTSRASADWSRRTAALPALGEGPRRLRFFRA